MRMGSYLYDSPNDDTLRPHSPNTLHLHQSMQGDLAKMSTAGWQKPTVP